MIGQRRALQAQAFTDMAIDAQPKRLAQPQRLLTLRDGRQVTVRAAVASDAAEMIQAFNRLSADSKYARFMAHKKQLNLAALERSLHPVPGQAFVFVATVPASDGLDIVGAAQYVRADSNSNSDSDSDSDSNSDSNDSDKRACEFAITVAEDWRGSGLAVHLLASLVRRSRRDSYETMEGLVIAGNRPMLAVARKLRFKVESVPADATVVRVERQLVRAERPR